MKRILLCLSRDRPDRYDDQLYYTRTEYHALLNWQKRAKMNAEFFPDKSKIIMFIITIKLSCLLDDDEWPARGPVLADDTWFFQCRRTRSWHMRWAQVVWQSPSCVPKQYDRKLPSSDFELVTFQFRGERSITRPHCLGMSDYKTLSYVISSLKSPVNVYFIYNVFNNQCKFCWEPYQLEM